MKLYNKILIITFILLATNIAEAQTFPANIPTGHRRIWWSPQRLAQAQQWFMIDSLGKTVVAAYKLETGAKSLIIDTQDCSRKLYVARADISGSGKKERK